MAEKCARVFSSDQEVKAWKIVSRLRTPAPIFSKSTAGLESVVARMTFLRIGSGGSSRLMAWAPPVSDLLIFFLGSSRALMRAPTGGMVVAGIVEWSAYTALRQCG